MNLDKTIMITKIITTATIIAQRERSHHDKWLIIITNREYKLIFQQSRRKISKKVENRKTTYHKTYQNKSHRPNRESEEKTRNVTTSDITLKVKL